jgi:soluble lytic murein transglycosylase-like protein
VSRRTRRLLAAAAAATACTGLALALLRVTHTRSVRESIDHWARHYHMDIHLARAVAWQESGNDPGALSSAGARGVMQVEPGTWTYTEHLLGKQVDDTTDGNIRVGIAYLHHLLGEFHGDLRLALAAYHQGPRAVRVYGVYGSSEHYVANVLALRARL